MNPTKKMIAEMRRENRKWPETLISIPKENWRPSVFDTGNRTAVYQSRHFLVQVFDEIGHIRLSINRADVGKDGRFVDGITWDELQKLKAECGFQNFLAIEFYPPDRDIVNVANLRHLFIPKTVYLPKHWVKPE